LENRHFHVSHPDWVSRILPKYGIVCPVTRLQNRSSTIEKSSSQ
jgi:hypothetical protein